MKLEKIKINTPLGVLKINGNAEGIHSVIFSNKKSPVSKEIPKVLQECVQQLEEYFEGTRKEFTVKLNPQGTEFQRKAWKSLQTIPYGKTMSYSEQSNLLNKPKAVRAVANANGKNLLAILVPCHRIIGSDGSLTGYAWGLERKDWLLNHESNIKQQSLF
ncbi:methylated-DNA--[protein]-cysteine S-methyltransferase [Flavicella sp.]|uniref:methylated-DNA--[protein]-cysteine S-methyltransferase n=1 Tax=Flavicella sp. TaxID=2957742 RepID=UPI00261DE3AB|nr:methylated-DNA--[protein]-cysteine S-methyltransferase [Flavicella sp.]MDG1804564.1 methylated-DNA--[protein]-cysteine S-methyltransferase [Flavicella sp.]MDG2280445.1 methylated-DNA--[protein]-cysteine S-methyltransferase [Flavicella sp.]